MATFQSVSRILTGRGCASALGEEARRLGRKALVVTGRTAMRKSGFTQRVCDSLHSAGLDTVLFEEVETEPASPTVDRGRELARKKECDIVIAMGGGSVLDAGKAIAALANEDRDTEQYVRGLEINAVPLPCIAAATTSGTGSEVTINSVITLPDEHTKRSIRGESLQPAVAIVDPELTLSLPPDITAKSGLDALTQAIESFISIHATPLTEGLSMDAAMLLAGNLDAACSDPMDIDAREACSYGSLMAGMALANARLGVVHGMAHPLGARYNIPHGLVCAVLLPHALRLNRPFAEEKFSMLGRFMAGDVLKFVDGLLNRLSIPRSLEPFGLCEEDFDEIIRQSMPSGSLKANPKEIDEEDVRGLLRGVM